MAWTASRRVYWDRVLVGRGVDDTAHVCFRRPRHVRGGVSHDVFSSITFAIVFALIALQPAPQAQTPPGVTPADVQVYEKFRAWVTMQPVEVQQGEPLDRYRTVLAAQGLNASEIARQIGIINEQGERLEIERWNRILTAPTPGFNTRPNAFLVEMTRGPYPGRALDVGMGQGRNALYLAQQGWAVTGFIPADRAVAGRRRKPGGSMFGLQRWSCVTISSILVKINGILSSSAMSICADWSHDCSRHSNRAEWSSSKHFIVMPQRLPRLATVLSSTRTSC